MLRLLFCHLAFQVNLCFDQLIYKLSEQVFSYYKHLAGSIYLDKALQWLCKKNNFQVTSPPPGRYHSLLKQTQVKVNCWNLHTRVVRYCTELSGLSDLLTRKRWKGDQIRVCSHLTLRARLHQASKSMLWKLCDDTGDTALIENNGVASEWGCNPFSSDSIVFNENSIASVIAELLQHWCWHLV